MITHGKSIKIFTREGCRRILRETRADVVLGMGGFTSLAPIRAGRSLGLRTYAVEELLEASATIEDRRAQIAMAAMNRWREAGWRTME